MSEYISLMTASMRKDFEFFSENAWPLSVEDLKPYRERFGKGDFSVIVKIVDGSFSAYIEKMQSSKQDHQRRFMYYVVTAQGKTGDNETAKAVKKIAANAVSDIQKLGEVFDREFPTEYIAKFDECRHTAATESEIQSKLISIAKSLPDISIETDVIKPNVVKLGLLDGNTDNFVAALNILNSENQNDGITLLAACNNTLKDDVIDFIQKEISYPAQGLIISDNNQVGDREIVKKKPRQMNLSQESSKSSSNLLNGLNMKVMKNVFLISLILNAVLVICLMFSRNSVKNLKDDLETKESELNSAKEQIVSLEHLKRPLFQDSISLDVETFVNSGIIKTKNQSQYDYAFQVVTPDTLAIYSNGAVIFRNGIDKLTNIENIDKMYKLFADFNDKLSQYLDATPSTQQTNIQTQPKKKHNK